MKTTRIHPKGNALLLAIVTTLLLFIIGMAFMLTSRTDVQTVTAVADRDGLDNAVQAVVNRINTVLVEDLFGTGGTAQLLDGTGANENWDYPYTNTIVADIGKNDDPWLASLEPETITISGTPYYYWRHITDLWGDNFGVPSLTLGTSTIEYFDPDVDTDPTQNQSGGSLAWYYWVANQNPTGLPYKATVARIVSDTDDTKIIKDQNDTTTIPNEWLWGARADADGDGVADARWVKVPGLSGPKGENVYTAVRIIDNCAMININTAYRNPSATYMATPGNWDGSQLSHVNMEASGGFSLMAGSDWEDGKSASTLQAARFGAWTNEGFTMNTIPGSPAYLNTNDYANDVNYETNVARRLLNPLPVPSGGNNYHYTPFDINDELQLRNRFFINPNATNRCGAPTLWQATFDPQASPGRYSPVGTNSGDTLQSWYINTATKWFLSPPTSRDIGDYNRRHIATTYSFDRVIVPQIANFSNYVLSTPGGFTPPGYTDNMPTALADAWVRWTNWNNTTPPLNWSYRPVSINDVATTSYNPIPPSTRQELLAAAIWLALPKGSDLRTQPNFTNTNTFPTASWSDSTVRERIACQLAVNMIDYFDAGSNPTSMTVSSVTYNGFESQQPRLYIASLGVAYWTDGTTNETHYAIELYNPTGTAVNAATFSLTIGTTSIPMTGSVPAGGTLIFADSSDANKGFAQAGTNTLGNISFDPNGLIIEIKDSTSSDPNQAPERLTFTVPASTTGANPANKYQLIRYSTTNNLLGETGTNYCTIPIWNLNAAWTGPLTGTPPTLATYTPAALTNLPAQARCADASPKTIGELENIFVFGDQKHISIPTDPNNRSFTQYLGTLNSIATGTTPPLNLARLNLADPIFANLLRFITIGGFNPASDSVDNNGNGLSDNPNNDDIDQDNDSIDLPGAGDSDTNEYPAYFEATELAVAGRININTAPWFVIAQLPWIQATTSGDEFKLAQAIVAYRDKLNLALPTLLNDPAAPDYATTGGAFPIQSRQRGMGLTGPNPAFREDSGFASIGELLNVTHNLQAGAPGWIAAPNAYYDLRRLGRNLTGGGAAIDDNPPSPPNPANPPPFYSNDNTPNDLLERDILFNRISNLATVRSDTFTAYIVVRIGEAGPQKRVMALFDRSNVFSPSDTPRLVYLQPVPEPK